MSETEVVETVETVLSDVGEVKPKKEKKPRASKKNAVAADVVKALGEGVASYDKASFTVYGHKSGVRLAVPKAGSVSRAYFYAGGDYALVPDHAAVKVFSEEVRKEKRLGGIMAEVDFSDVALATEALGLLLAAVKAAVPVEKKKPAPKKKAAVAEEASSDAQ